MVRIFLLFAAFLCTYSRGMAQAQEDPAHWTYEIKKTASQEYDLIFHLSLDAGWHIWSLHPGGDGYEIAPSFNFPNNSNFTLVGDVTEKGRATTTKMEGIDGAITYLSGKISYIQHVKLLNNVKLMGKHTYQVCNDKLCLPPKELEFVFDVH